MVAALVLTDREISEVFRRVYDEMRRNIFPLPQKVESVRNYAETAGLYRACQYCGKSLKEYAWKAHYAVHALQGTTDVRFIG